MSRLPVKDAFFSIRFAYALRRLQQRHASMGLTPGRAWASYAEGISDEVATRLPVTERSTFRGRAVLWIEKSDVGGNELSVANPPAGLKLLRAPRRFVPPEAQAAWRVIDSNGRAIHPAAQPLICAGEPNQGVTGTMFFNEPVDAVITWVDGSDPEWVQRKSAFKPGQSARESSNVEARFSDNTELRACLRGIAAYAPWIRHIFIVTDQQVPAWLDQSAGQAGGTGVSIVDHREILPHNVLPTFNSHVIESALHRIPGLSEHYLYFNDDVILGAPSTPEDFFTPAGQMRVSLSGQGIHGDLPVMDSARKNRELLMQLTGTIMDRRYKHVPHAQLRSVAYELEETIEGHISQTRSHRFRNPADVSFASSLLLSYAVATGHAVPSALSYSYIDVGQNDAVRRLGGLLRERTAAQNGSAEQGYGRLVNCFNQVETMSAGNSKALRKTLEAMWPWVCPWETT